MKKILPILLLLLLGMNLCVGYVWYRRGLVRNRIGEALPFSDAGKFLQVRMNIQQGYVDEERLSSEKLLAAALEGMTSGLDAHSAFLPPDAVLKMNEDSQGVYCGIGVRFSPEEGDALEIQSIVPDSPAAKAGLEIGDRILGVNGVPFKDGKGPEGEDPGESIRGPQGSWVTLAVWKKSEQKQIELKLQRDIIHSSSVVGTQILPGTSIGYLRLLEFIEPSAEEMQKALQELCQTQKATGLVLDLRDNPGGLLTSAVDICSFFLPAESLIVTMRGRAGAGKNRTDGLRAKKMPFAVDAALPVVILLNGNSASAAEITAGCLSDYGRVTLVGEKSYGKGTVQDVVEFVDGSALKMTIARYHTPSSQRLVIDGNGIVPDIEVKIQEKEYLPLLSDLVRGQVHPEQDAQLKKAIWFLQSLPPAKDLSGPG